MLPPRFIYIYIVVRLFTIHIQIYFQTNLLYAQTLFIFIVAQKEILSKHFFFRKTPEPPSTLLTERQRRKRNSTQNIYLFKTTQYERYKKKS